MKISNFKNKTALLFAVCIALAAISAVVGLAAGSVSLTLPEILGGITGKEGFEMQTTIINYIRFPRVIGSALAGISLAVSGVILQTVTNNALCSANVLGINSGAGLGVMLAICFAPSAIAMYPAAAFAGAAAVTLLVIVLSGKAGASRLAIVLSGIAISSICSAIISFLSLRYPEQLVSYTAFTTGSFAGIQWESLKIPSLIIAVCLAGTFIITPQLELLCLGDTMAMSLGVKVKQTRIICLVIVSALVASVVSYAGILSFVGLIIPHIARKFVGSSLRRLMPLSAIMGFILVECADIAGRVFFAPTELPAGIITALAGSPFFLYLLIARRSEV